MPSVLLHLFTVPVVLLLTGLTGMWVARDRRMTPMARSVVLLIEAYPPKTPLSSAALAKASGLRMRTVERATACAKACRYLRRKPGGVTRDGKVANRYEILFPKPSHPRHQ